MIKIIRFKDIPQFTRAGNYEIEYDLERFVEWLDREQNEYGLQLMPDFQRSHVWKEEQQIAYLEYFFKGGRSGRIIYLNFPSWNNTVQDGEYNDYVCVDGLQRITAIQRFMHDEIPIFGSYYHEFTDGMFGSIHTIKVNVNDLKTKEEVLLWYIDMNDGGTPHTSEEIENVRRLLNSCT